MNNAEARLTSATFLIGDRCNAVCSMCWQAKRRENTPKSEWRPEMSVECVEAVLQQSATTLVAVELVSYGETLMNPDFGAMADAVAEAGRSRGRAIELSLITNGSLLEKFADKIAPQPGFLTVSIDAADKGLYESIRRGLVWEEVRDGLRSIVKHPKRHEHRHVGINCTVFEDNVAAVGEMGAFAADEGVDYLAVLHGAALDKTFAAGREIDRRDPRLIDQIARIRTRFPSLRLNDYATQIVTDNMSDGRCNLPWKHMDIGTDGRAHPCCRSHGTDLGTPAEAFHGPAMTELRKQIESDDVEPAQFADCARCEMLGARVRGAKLVKHRLPLAPARG